MISERPILDGESANEGQKATVQCLCQWGTNKQCYFVDLPNLRKLIYRAEAGEFDKDPQFVQHVFNAYWSWMDHEHKVNLGLQRQAKTLVKYHAGHELGAREFTLTYSPQWGITDDDARILMSKAVQKLAKYYKNEIKEFFAVGEVTKQGCSHIHGYYLLRGGKKMTDKNFKRAYKYWNPKVKLGKRGFQGGHHENVTNEADFKGYIDKCPDAWFTYEFIEEEHNNARENEEDPTTSSRSVEQGEESGSEGSGEEEEAE